MTEKPVKYPIEHLSIPEDAVCACSDDEMCECGDFAMSDGTHYWCTGCGVFWLIEAGHTPPATSARG